MVKEATPSLYGGIEHGTSKAPGLIITSLRCCPQLLALEFPPLDFDDRLARKKASRCMKLGEVVKSHRRLLVHLEIMLPKLKKQKKPWWFLPPRQR